jgi:hypothetical protein
MESGKTSPSFFDTNQSLAVALKVSPADMFEQASRGGDIASVPQMVSSLRTVC